MSFSKPEINVGDVYYIEGDKVIVTSVNQNYVQFRYEDSYWGGCCVTRDEFEWKVFG